MENSRGEGRSSPKPEGSLAWSWSRRSGSRVMAPVSTVAEAAMAPAMISPCVIRLWTLASISPCRNWFR
jgi:hypothetical protein